MKKPDLDAPPAIDRTRRLIAEMRQVIEDARLSVLTAQDLLKRLPGSEDPVQAGPPDAGHPDNLTLRLIDLLLDAHTVANLEDDGEAQALLETALLRVGQRLARQAGPRAAGLVLQ